MISIIWAVFSGFMALAQPNGPSEGYPINELLVANYHREKNTVDFVITLIYPSSCYSPLASSGIADEANYQIFLSHITSIDPGICVLGMLPRHYTIEMERPPNGVYKIHDIHTKKYLGDLFVNDEEVSLIAERSGSGK
jgi:hypothetical protein